jgi:two-component system NtrC family sensor kinase
VKLSDISYRIKIPLAISAVILLTELTVATALVNRAYSDARSDLEASARNLSTVLARSLRDPLVRDDLWQAYEVITTPLAARSEDNPLQEIVVLDSNARVFVASNPRRVPVLTPASELEPTLFAVAASVERVPFVLRMIRGDDSNEMGAAGSILAEDGTRVGTVLLSFDAERYYHRVRSTLLQLGLISLPGLLILIPLGWYWGKRIAEPLSELATALARVGRDAPDSIAADLPAASRDEIGQLSHQVQQMLGQLARKDAIEQEMVASERLAAVGRVAAAIAHEINNPLGGMLNAIDTVRHHGHADQFTRKTLGLLERGLEQIRTTVSALLVEARLDSPSLAAQDWQDLHTLIQPQVGARGLRLVWEVDLPAGDRLALPAHLIRQLALNILLNAVKSAEPGGTVGLRASRDDESLSIVVSNTGPPIPLELLPQLFEPFAAATVRDGKRSYGLGLWVCYQIVQQLRGTISAESSDGWTRFVVCLPLDAAKGQPVRRAQET